MNCKNCLASLGCSCQVRTASDGKSCCSECVQKYEMTKGNSLPNNDFQKSPPITLNGGPITPKISSIVFNNFNK